MGLNIVATDLEAIQWFSQVVKSRGQQIENAYVDAEAVQHYNKIRLSTTMTKTAKLIEQLATNSRLLPLANMPKFMKGRLYQITTPEQVYDCLQQYNIESNHEGFWHNNESYHSLMRNLRKLVYESI